MTVVAMSLITASLGRIAAPERRTMGVACGAHVLHDGYTDLLYVLLPLWQVEFGLGYAEVGLLRALYTGSMASFQVPAGVLAERIGGPLLLGLGTALVGVGYLVAGATAGLLMLMPWRSATVVLGMAALAGAAAILAVRGLPGGASQAVSEKTDVESRAAPDGRGFPLLLSIAMIDSATRMGFLTFLPFLLKMKGADLPMIGIALTLIFTGGAAGKLVCGWLGERLGMVPATILTEALTAVGILVLLPLPLFAGLLVLPLIGVALNGTSSVLYGTVPELVAPERRQRAFSIFYTGGIGAGALSPVLYGAASDLADVPVMMVLVAGVVLTTLPLTWALRPALREIRAQA